MLNLSGLVAIVQMLFQQDSKWHWTRIWRGWPIALAPAVMPFSRFLSGTHKYYFRALAAVFVTSFATGINIVFHGSAVWVSYLCGFGAISLIYWLIYAPAKWIESDLIAASSGADRTIRSAVENHNPTASDPHSSRWQAFIHGGIPLREPSIPKEVETLIEYLDSKGQRPPSTSNYLYGKRTWYPPDFWAGISEYRRLEADSIAMLESDGRHKAERIRRVEEVSGDRTQGRCLLVLYRTIFYLDSQFPHWRDEFRV